MYETEAHEKIESSSQIPPEVLSAFGELKGKVDARTLISWGEHCTECGWPTCYSTCDLYEPRKDLKCQRFVDGMVRINCGEATNGYLLKISFKRWGTLWARGNFRLYKGTAADRLERRDYRIATALRHLPAPPGVQRSAGLKRYAFKKRMANRGADGRERPTHFIMECYNPRQATVKLSLTMRSMLSAHPSPFPTLVQLAPGFSKARELTESKIPFQKLIDVNPGFNRISIPFEELAGVMDLRSPFSAHITPNEVEDGSTLYFGLVDFVRGSPVKSPARKNLDAVKTLKCVVWDLDHTLWDGVLVEDGPEKLKLKPGVVEVIQELDRRGILQSVASKNDPEEALRVLRSHALEEYFLYPKISWEPKSDAIAAIARDLNIGMDTILFVDDSEFERQEVMSACPGVRVLDARLFRSLPDREECQVPVTGESAARRKMYQVEGSRQKVAESFGSDYMTFLSHCEIRLKITPLSEENLERVHELTQRTNQMNFSGNRYDRNVLHAIIGKPHLDTYVIACEDRFGSYGVVGFSIVDSREPRMTDLMFSCRIQSKRVEHAFLSFLIRKYRTRAAQDFLANYKKTSRNAPAGRVFPDLQMREIENQDGVSVWVFPKDQTPLDDGLVLIDAVDEAVRSC